MEDQEKIQKEEEVEAHRRRGQHPHASDDKPKQEGDDEQDVELHRHRGPLHH